jgi:hypothetical protein
MMSDMQKLPSWVIAIPYLLSKVIQSVTVSFGGLTPSEKDWLNTSGKESSNMTFLNSFKGSVILDKKVKDLLILGYCFDH